MAVLLTKILWYRVQDRDSSVSGINSYGSAINITSAVDLDLSKGIDIKGNVLNFTLKNPNSEFIESGQIMFVEQDQIKVYAKYSEDGLDLTLDDWDLEKPDEPDADYLLGTFYVVEYKEIHSDKEKKLAIKCVDKTYVMFNQLIPLIVKTTDNLSAPEVIQEVIRKATESDSGLYQGSGDNPNVYYDVDAKLEDSESGYVTDVRRSTKEDGSSNSATDFPVIQYSSTFKPVYDIISELSSVDYTNTTDEVEGIPVYGRSFIFWLDEDNKFHWIYPSQTEDATLVVGTDDIYKESMTKKVMDTVNMIIFTAGDDLYNTGIWDYYYDVTSDSKGLKMKYIAMTNIVRDVLEEDYTVNTSRASATKYDFPASYPITPSWTTTSCTNDATYNTSLRTECKSRGRNKSKQLTAGLSSARWKGNIEVKGRRYTAGNLIKYTSSEQGLTEVLLRITNVQHNFSKSGWFTSLTLEEDEKALTEVD